MSHNFTYYDFAICFDASSSLTGVFLRFPLPLLSVYFSKIFLAFFKKKKKQKPLWSITRARALSRLSRVMSRCVCAALGTAARQAPLSLGASRQEYWSGLPCSLPDSSQGRNPSLLHQLYCSWILYSWATREAHRVSFFIPTPIYTD